MKKELLKSLLLAIAMLTGLNVNAQIRAKWTIPADAKTGLCSIKTAVGFGEKLFGVNCDAGTVEEWEDGKLIASYDVNKFCADNQYGEMLYVTGATGDVIYQEFKTYTLWGAVMVDDAGNILANVWSTSPENSCQNWVLLPANDRTKMQLLHIDEFPSTDVTLGYVDMPSRIVGDIAGEGAYLYITPARSTYMPIMFIGLDDNGKIYYNNEFSWVLRSSQSFDDTTNVATLQTFDDIYNAVEDRIVAAKTYIRWSYQDSPFTWDAETDQFAKNATVPQGIYHSGMDIFKIGEVEYIVLPIKSATTYKNGCSVAVYNLADGSEVASYDAVSAINYSNIGSVQARVNPDGKTANIYVCSQKDCFGIFEFDPQSSSAAITSITLDKAKLTLGKSMTAKLNVSVTTNDGSAITDFTWSSNNASVATVDVEGNVTAVAAGTAYITVRPNGKSSSVSCIVTVVDIISNGINYNITSDIEPYTVEVIEGNYTGDVVIPESIEKDEITYTVKSIKSNAFRSCEITSIAIPESIENIGERAFEGCKSLTSIVIPNSIKSINWYAFSNSGLTSVEIPESVNTIGYYAFSYCSRLKSVVIPEGVTAIEEEAFYQCYGLESITLPSTLNSIGSGAFESSVVIGENENGGLVMEKFKRKIVCNATTPPALGSFAFVNNKITMEVPFASMMAYKEDESWAKYDIIYLSEEVEGQNFVPTSDSEIEISGKNEESESYNGDVVIPGEVIIEDQTYTVSSIGESAFANCTEITSVSIPESISTIAVTAFDGCTGLELLDMSESKSLTSINSNTFSTCTALETVNFPFSLESIGASAFANCANLSNMSLPCTTPPVLDAENNPFEGVDATACIISIPTESVNAYTLSDSWNKFVNPSSKSDIQISVVNNEPENENNCTIRFKKFIDNTIEPTELMANNIKATLTEEDIISGETPDAMTSNGQSLFVANGDAVTFHIIPDEATEITKVLYNETDVTQQVVNNTFTTPKVNAKSSLQVILKTGTPTGVENSFIEETNVVEMARYDISGRLISIPVKGINFVKMSDGTMKKVIVK